MVLTYQSQSSIAGRESKIRKTLFKVYSLQVKQTYFDARKRLVARYLPRSMNLPFLSRLQALAQPGASVTNGAVATQAAATVEAVQAALPELLAVAVIDIESGQALATHSNVPSFSPAKAAPHNAEVVRQKRRALEALSLSNEKIEDILITLREQLHLLRVSSDNQRLLYLAVSTHDTNLAIARHVLRAHSG